ncbi:HNH endonuclease [Kaistia nematophila]|uniref:HNH endonuclease n=1 Tax=Kaistia nematophila TaxID=2994654 RepID=A0A9X3EC48_9HYPH|nr:HNH endonuclease [Kaistia nematophila]MCX5570160.1 HNH endonuclease [Kaistia nematophila]
MIVNAVFTTKVSPAYDDLPEVRYHFPRTYLNQVEAALGDWIVYYEPRRSSADLQSRGGRQCYFAIARVASIEPDPSREGRFYAHMMDYLEFDRPVPFSEGGHYYESALRKLNGSTNKGAFRRAVRNLLNREFELIVAAGFAHALGNAARERPYPDPPESPQSPMLEASEAEGRFNYDLPETEPRRIVEQLIARPFRDRAFVSAVKTAYDDRCAITGIKIINGGGRSEVQAAHIQPVAADGPDSVRNGIALSGTVHWLFDRGLISIDDDYQILTASQLPDTMHRWFLPEGRMALPQRIDLRPHPAFLKFHREQVFKA